MFRYSKAEMLVINLWVIFMGIDEIEQKVYFNQSKAKRFNFDFSQLQTMVNISIAFPYSSL